MADIVDTKTRSKMMSGIQGKDTRPEVVIRKALFARGFRYRLHARDLPGKPDIVLPKHRAVIHIHGCFWHGHQIDGTNCPLFKWPGTRPDFWREKIGSNQARDMKVENALATLGWRQATIWECALKGRERLDFASITDSLAVWLNGKDTRLLITGKSQGWSTGRR